MSANHIYTAVGVFAAQVTVHDVGGSTAMTSTTVTITHAPPAWLATGGAATYDPVTHVLTVTGAVVIIADPGSGNPIITGNSSAAQVTIATTAGPLVHLGGVNLTGGAGVDFASFGTTRTHTHHNIVLITNPLSTTLAPTFTIDASSKFDAEDNDLLIHNGTFANIQAAAVVGRNGTTDPNNNGTLADGTWTGNGLTSSKAAASATSHHHLETTALATVKYGDLILPFDNNIYSVGTTSLVLSANDTIVKYTYVDDFALEGKVTGNSSTIFGVSYGNKAGKFRNNDFRAAGSYNGGSVLSDASTLFGVYYGYGTGVDGSKNARM